jgi:hypothetical protein
LAIIVKAHTFTPQTPSFSSESNRNFDDIYTEFNGNINSANIAAAYTIAASQVSFNDTAALYAGTNLEDSMREAVTVKGHNSIACFTVFNTGGLVLTPGKIEVNNSYSYVTAAVVISFANLLTDSATVMTIAGDVYCVGIKGGLSSTNGSDVRVKKYTSTSASNGIDPLTGGVYYDGGNRRVIGTVKYLGYGPTGFTDHFSPQSPQVNGVLYSFNETDSSGAGFTVLSIGTTAAKGFWKIWKEYDHENMSYAVRALGSIASACMNMGMYCHNPSGGYYHRGNFTIMTTATNYTIFSHANVYPVLIEGNRFTTRLKIDTSNPGDVVGQACFVANDDCAIEGNKFIATIKKIKFPFRGDF